MNGSWIIRYRWGIIVATAALVLTAAIQTRHLIFSTDYRDFFKSDDPRLQVYEHLGRSYTNHDNVLFVLAPKDGDVFTRETLSAVEELTEAARYTPYFIRVDSLTNFPHALARGDHITVKAIAENPRQLTDAQLERGKQLALSDPIFSHRLISTDGRATGVNVTIYFPRRVKTESHDVVTFVRGLADDIRRKYPDLRVYLGGSVLFGHAFYEAARKDLITIFPAMYVAIALVLLWVLRSLAATLLVLLVILFSDVVAAGFAGWFHIPVSAVAANAPTIILTIAVADSIHLLTTFFSLLDEGKSKYDSILESLHINGRAIFITSVVTAISFLCFNFHASPPYRDMGNLVTVGVLAAYFFSILFLPAALSFLPITAKPDRLNRQNLVLRFGEWVIRNNKPVFRGVLILVLVLMVPLTKVELDEKITEYISKRIPFRNHTDFIAKNFTGIWTLEYSMETGEKRGIVKPEYLEKLDTFSTWFGRQPETVFVSTVSDIVKRLNRTMHGDDDSFYRIPWEPDLAAQYLIIYEMSLPVGVDLDTQIRPDESASRFIAVLKNLSTRQLLDLETRAEHWLEKNVPTTMARHGSSLPVLFSHLARDNVKHMIMGSLFALFLISGLLIWFLRSFRYGLISLVPNLVPPVMAFGLWGLLVGKMGLAVSVVTLIGLGIVFNDTVHFLCNYLRGRRNLGLDIKESLRMAYKTAGRAIATTSFILFFGFFILLFSGFTVNRDMGIFTGFTILFALVTDLMLLPALLIKFDIHKNEKTHH